MRWFVGERDTEDIIGEEAAPDGGATEHIFGYGEEGGGCMLWTYGCVYIYD